MTAPVRTVVFSRTPGRPVHVAPICLRCGHLIQIGVGPGRTIREHCGCQTIGKANSA